MFLSEDRWSVCSSFHIEMQSSVTLGRLLNGLERGDSFDHNKYTDDVGSSSKGPHTMDSRAVTLTTAAAALGAGVVVACYLVCRGPPPQHSATQQPLGTSPRPVLRTADDSRSQSPVHGAGDPFPVAADPLIVSMQRSRQLHALKLDLLSRVPLLRGAPVDVHELLATKMRHMHYTQGAVFCQEGDWGDTMFFVVTGDAELEKRNMTKRPLKVFTNGEFFGEMAAVLGMLRQGTVRAGTDCDVFVVDRASVLDAIALHPPLLEAFRIEVSRRLIVDSYTPEERLQPAVQAEIQARLTAEQALIADRKQKGGSSRTWRKTKRIGRGAMGEVWAGVDTASGEPLAIKIVHIGPDMQPRTVLALQQEADFLLQLHHPNIVQGIATEKTGESLVLVMELMPMGSLQSVIHEMGGRVPEAVAKSYSRQLLQGLAFLHERGVIHRDIKPANCLLSAAGVVKLADFGLARQHTTLATAHVCGTPAYLSPEAIRGHYSVKSDIWALAMSLLEMVTGRSPWSHLPVGSANNVASLLLAIATFAGDTYPVETDAALLSAPLVDLLNAALSRDPEQRPTAREMLSHVWFADQSSSSRPTTSSGSLLSSITTTPSQAAGDLSVAQQPSVPVSTHGGRNETVEFQDTLPPGPSASHTFETSSPALGLSEGREARNGKSLVTECSIDF